MSLAIACLRCGVAALLLCAAGAGSDRPVQLPPFGPITAADSVLVVAPHPDDESLCCGGLISTARRAGADVAIVWITSGDAFTWDAIVVEKTLRPRPRAYRDLARRRIGEARSAAAILDVPREAQYFLGYPDRGVLPLLFDFYHRDWRSKFTGESAVPFADELDPGSLYDGEDLVRDFGTVVERVQPTLVLAPSPRDTHPDHRAAGLLAMRVMQSRDELSRVRYWIVHGGRHWPSPRAYHPQLPQTIAPKGVGMAWEQLYLDEDARTTKHDAVMAHRTQLEVMGRVMQSHVRATELYSRVAVPEHDAGCLRPEPCDFEEAPVSEKAAL